MSGTTSTPGPVVNLQAGTPAQTSVPLTWSAPTSGAAPTSYTVDYSLAGQNSFGNAVTGVTATSETIIGLVAGTSYDFRVTPVNASGSGTPTIEAGITTAAVPATTPLTDTGYYAPAIMEGLHRGAFVVRESNGFRSRERATLNNGGTAAVYYPPGLVVALSGVPGAYTVAPFTSSGTATTAAAILYDGKLVQASETLSVAIVAREAEVNFLELQFDPSITTAAQQLVVRQALAATQIICR